MTAADAPQPRTAAASPHHHDVSDVAAELGTDPARGLSAVDARRRLEQYGHNELAGEQPVPAWRRFLAQFQDVLVLLLLAATAISAALWLYERDAALPYEALAILAVVLLNATMGYVQESRAEAALASLRAMSAAVATVVREGTPQKLAASELVPADVLRIEEGDTIPADARLFESVALQMSEATLTGESLPVAKTTAPAAAMHRSAIAGTWCSAAHRQLTATDGRSSRPPA